MEDRVYRLRTGRVDWRAVDDEVIVLDLERAEYVAINSSGAQLWPLLVEGATRDRFVRRLQETFGLDEVRAERDVDSFLDSLEAQQLLEPTD